MNGETWSVPHSFQRLQPSKLITRFDAPFIHMTYAEVEFLIAEAAYRGWNAGEGSAESHFEKALDAAVRQWSLFDVSNLDETAITDFINFNKNNFAGNELTEINTQLWILHFLDPMETWANWRRTGIPEINFIVWSDNASNGKIPRRMEYPIEEQTKNAENYQEAVSRMGGTDDWTNRIWWDKE
ncbi:MAG: SusD/RagB family nutrient-binding outer membrane lipoprotein [Prevotellaceae bacterium]|nr:SusD/RagB family nutrient-binding outer membrane lipoprotein [Prevotellaceae bacterium]